MLFGLMELNNILDEWRDKIPFNSTVTFDNVENLQNSRFINVKTVNYVLNNVSYELPIVSLVRWKEIQQITNLTGFPQYAFFDELTQSINIYPSPQGQPYQFTVWGKIQTTVLGLFDTIPANMPPFMANAVTYELAFRLAAEYGADWDAKKETIRQSLISQLMEKNSVDLSAPADIVFGVPASNSAPVFPYFYYMSGGI